MKTLYLVGGTMGIGKTTVCQILKKRLPACVFLDGDWCWDADPFTVTDETKRMVMENIRFLLSQFLRAEAYENIVFCWVMHTQSIIHDVLAGLPAENVRVVPISLMATPEALEARLAADVAVGLRMPDVIDRSLARIALYDTLDTIKIDTTALSPEAVAEKIVKI